MLTSKLKVSRSADFASPGFRLKEWVFFPETANKYNEVIKKKGREIDLIENGSVEQIAFAKQCVMAFYHLAYFDTYICCITNIAILLLSLVACVCGRSATVL